MKRGPETASQRGRVGSDPAQGLRYRETNVTLLTCKVPSFSDCVEVRFDDILSKPSGQHSPLNGAEDSIMVPDNVLSCDRISYSTNVWDRESCHFRKRVCLATKSSFLSQKF